MRTGISILNISISSYFIRFECILLDCTSKLNRHIKSKIYIFLYSLVGLLIIKIINLTHFIGVLIVQNNQFGTCY